MRHRILAFLTLLTNRSLCLASFIACATPSAKPAGAPRDAAVLPTQRAAEQVNTRASPVVDERGPARVRPTVIVDAKLGFSQQVSFERNSSLPTGDSLALIDGVAKLLREYSCAWPVLLIGHASSDESNATKLSMQRAEAVLDLLVAHGVDRARLRVEAADEDKHNAEVSGPGDDAARGRSVEFVARGFCHPKANAEQEQQGQAASPSSDEDVQRSSAGPRGRLPLQTGTSHMFRRTPLRQLFDVSDFVASVYARNLTQGLWHAGTASLIVGDVFKGDSSRRPFDYSWEEAWTPRPERLGHKYIALLRNGKSVTDDAAFLDAETIMVDAVAGVTDSCWKVSGSSSVTCDVFKVSGSAHDGVLFDLAMVRHLTIHLFEVSPPTTAGIDVVLVDDVERAFCEWAGGCATARPQR